MKMLLLGLFLAIPCIAGEFRYSALTAERESMLSIYEEPTWVNGRGQSFLISSTSNLNAVCRALNGELIHADLDQTQFTTISAKQSPQQSTVREYKFGKFQASQNNSYVSSLACLPF